VEDIENELVPIALKPYTELVKNT